MNARNIRRIAVSVIWVIAFIVWALWDHGSSHHHDGHSASTQQQPSEQEQGGQGSGQGQNAQTSGGSLDFGSIKDFTLALSWEPGFCRDHGQRDECRNAGDTPLTLHGFWPGVPASLGRQGVSRGDWYHDGCMAVDHQSEGSFCSFPKPQLSSNVRQSLESAMPGVQSCLDRHEYAKHGACFNISADQYFSHATRLYQQVSQSRFAQWLKSHRGQQVARQDVISTFGSTFKTSGRSLMVMCDGSDYLTELRIGINGSHLNDFPASDSFSRLGNGRCGSQVKIP